MTTPALWDARGRLAWSVGDGSERCVVCGLRARSDSYYVGQAGLVNDQDEPERFPVCGEAHGLMWMETVWRNALWVQDTLHERKTVVVLPTPTADVAGPAGPAVSYGPKTTPPTATA